MNVDHAPLILGTLCTSIAWRTRGPTASSRTAPYTTRSSEASPSTTPTKWSLRYRLALPSVACPALPLRCPVDSPALPPPLSPLPWFLSSLAPARAQLASPVACPASSLLDLIPRSLPLPSLCSTRAPLLPPAMPFSGKMALRYITQRKRKHKNVT